MATAIVGPTGVEAIIHTTIPVSAHTTAMQAEHITAFLKVLKTRIAESAGKVIREEMSKAPTIFIAITITIPVTTASRVL